MVNNHIDNLLSEIRANVSRVTNINLTPTDETRRMTANAERYWNVIDMNPRARPGSSTTNPPSTFTRRVGSIFGQPATPPRAPTPDPFFIFNGSLDALERVIPYRSPTAGRRLRPRSSTSHFIRSPRTTHSFWPSGIFPAASNSSATRNTTRPIQRSNQRDLDEGWQEVTRESRPVFERTATNDLESPPPGATIDGNNNIESIPTDIDFIDVNAYEEINEPATQRTPTPFPSEGETSDLEGAVASSSSPAAIADEVKKKEVKSLENEPESSAEKLYNLLSGKSKKAPSGTKSEKNHKASNKTEILSRTLRGKKALSDGATNLTGSNSRNVNSNISVETSFLSGSSSDSTNSTTDSSQTSDSNAEASSESVKRDHCTVM